MYEMCKFFAFDYDPNFDPTTRASVAAKSALLSIFTIFYSQVCNVQKENPFFAKKWVSATHITLYLFGIGRISAVRNEHLLDLVNSWENFLMLKTAIGMSTFSLS